MNFYGISIKFFACNLEDLWEETSGMSHARFRSNRDLIYADELALIGDDDNQVSDSGIGGIRKRSRELYRSVVQLRTRFERSFFLSRIYLLGGKGKFVVSARD